MFRLLRQTLAAGSFLLLLAAVALWVRGYWKADEISFTSYSAVPAETPDPYADMNYYENSDRPEDREAAQEQHARFLSQLRTNRIYKMSLARGGVYVSWDLYDFRWYPRQPVLDWEADPEPPTSYAGPYLPEELDGKRWGWMHIDHARLDSGSGGSRDAYRERGLLLPIWALAALLAIAPGFWLTGIVRRQRRARRQRREGRCPECGYDLRASPQRCPECGRLAGDSPAAATSGRAKPLPGFWRELLPLCISAVSLFALAGGGYLLLSSRVAAMERLHTADRKQKAAAEAAQMAIQKNDAQALRTALDSASVYGPKEIARLLRGMVMQNEQGELARALLDHGADVPHLRGAILQQALLYQNYALARALIEKGANLNAASDDDDRPPLALCLSDNDEAMALFELLLKKGADPSGRTNPKLGTLLHTLVQGDETVFPKRVRIAEMLIAKGADVNATAGDTEATPLCLANEDDPDPLVQLLKAKGGKRLEKKFEPEP